MVFYIIIIIDTMLVYGKIFQRKAKLLKNNLTPCNFHIFFASLSNTVHLLTKTRTLESQRTFRVRDKQ